jgi:hypothetical protein
MFLKYWIFTTGEGEAYVNLTSNLRIKEPEDGAIIKMGVFLPLEAGKNTSYDTGLCTLVYKKDGAKQKPPQIEDKFYANMNSWFKVGEQPSCPSRPKALQPQCSDSTKVMKKWTAALQAEEMEDCVALVKNEKN